MISVGPAFTPFPHPFFWYILVIMIIKRFLFVLVLLAVAVLSLAISCASAAKKKSVIEVKFDQDTFNEQRKLWQESNIKDYRYNFGAYGFKSFEGTVIVINGEYLFNYPIPDSSLIDTPAKRRLYEARLEKRMSLDYDAPDDRDDEFIKRFKKYSTIDKIYETIEEAFNRYNNKEYSEKDFYYDAVYVEYDEINHIPKRVGYGLHIPKGLMVDGTFQYHFTDFNER